MDIETADAALTKALKTMESKLPEYNRLVAMSWSGNATAQSALDNGEDTAHEAMQVLVIHRPGLNGSAYDYAREALDIYYTIATWELSQ